MNDDCLREIFKYLNFLETVNCGATCKRLLTFVKTNVYPMKAKEISIHWEGNDTMILTCNRFSSKSPMKIGATYLSYFGDSIEDLSLSSSKSTKGQFIRSYEMVIDHCKYLKILRFTACDFTLDETPAPQDRRFQRFQHLKELHLSECTGFERQLGQIDNLEHLKIKDPHNWSYEKNTIDHQFIAMWITYKLPQLKSMAFTGKLSNSSMYLTELPQLQFLDIFVEDFNANSLLRKLSDNGNIEELSMIGGVFDDEDNMTAPPLIFSRLQKFCWQSPYRIPNFIKTIARAQMPVIRSFELTNIEHSHEIHVLLKFLEANSTLETIILQFESHYNHVSDTDLEFFVLHIIGILKVPCIPARPMVNMKIYPDGDYDETVSKFNYILFFKISKTNLYCSR